MNPDHQPGPPTWRKPAGVFLIILIIAIWAWLVVSAVDYLGDVPTLLLLLLYAIAGVIWIAPLRPILIWMETGRWR
jgi:UPF0716 family protein affecting phage T7 exclusion